MAIKHLATIIKLPSRLTIVPKQPTTLHSPPTTPPLFPPSQSRISIITTITLTLLTSQVKRNTEAGFIPMEGLTTPQSSGGAFRFPRTSSRGGRKLELPEEVEIEEDKPVLSGFRFSKERGGWRLDIDVEEETDLADLSAEDEEDVKLSGFRFSKEKGGRRLDLDVQEDDILEEDEQSVEEKSDTVEVVYSEETAPQGGNVKFVERRKRSPDGDHHGAHGHHGAHHGVQSQPFGPNGVRPPTCGGPASGYVCCRNSGGSSFGSFSSPALDFNELAPASSIRDVRQQPQQFNGVVSSAFGGQFSSYGQCGKRNAHGVTGRINNPAQKYDEGDTEFGEYPWQAAILKKEEYDNVYVCGGSLIDSSHILTAAHCIKQYRPEELRIRLGEWDVNNDSEFYPNVELDVLSISIHPDFYSGNLYKGQDSDTSSPSIPGSSAQEERREKTLARETVAVRSSARWADLGSWQD